MARTPRPAVRVRVIDIRRRPLVDARVVATPSSLPRLRFAVWRLVARILRIVCGACRLRLCTRSRVLAFDPYWNVFTAPLTPGVYRIRVALSGYEAQTRTVAVQSGRGVDVTFFLGPAAPARFYYRDDVKIPFEHYDVVAVALRPGHWDEDFIDLAEAQGIALDGFSFQKLTPPANVRRQGIQLFRVAPADHAGFEQAARRHPLVAAAGAIVAATPKTVSFLTNEIVVQFSRGDSGLDAKSRFPYTMTELPWAADRYVAQAPATEDSLAVLERINGLAAVQTGIRSVTPNLFHTFVDHMSPPNGVAALQAQPHHALIHTQDAFTAGVTGQNTVIAVIDYGCDADHPDLKPKVRFKYDFLKDSQSIAVAYHGTCCAGLAAGSFNGVDGFCGVAPDADLVIVIRPEPKDIKMANMFHWLTGVDVFKNNPPPLGYKVDVISCSWALDVDKLEADIDGALDTLAAQGTVVVFSAGNAQDGDWELQPVGEGALASYPTVIAVGSSSLSPGAEHLASDSRYGEPLDIVAPGGGEGSVADGEDAAPFPRNNPQMTSGTTGLAIPYGTFAQTSCACPQVAGVAALVRSAAPNLSADEVAKILFDSAIQIGDSSDYDNGLSLQYGHGRVDAGKAVAAALNRQQTTFITK